jgi:hypothetical protein
VRQNFHLLAGFAFDTIPEAWGKGKNAVRGEMFSASPSASLL